MRLPLTMGVLAACGLVLAAPVPKEKSKPVKDEDAILGTWRVDKYEGADGPPADEVAKLLLVFEDGRVTTLAGGVLEAEQMPYTLDPTARPKAIDFAEKGGVIPGIYELDGDTLRLCFVRGSREARPTELKAAGKGVALITLKRVDDEKKGK